MKEIERESVETISKSAKELFDKLKDFHGKKFTATICGKPTDGRISVEEHEIFLCQNTHSGDVAEDTLGYSFSWSLVMDSSAGSFISPDVSELIILHEVEDINADAPPSDPFDSGFHKKLKDNICSELVGIKGAAKCVKDKNEDMKSQDTENTAWTKCYGKQLIELGKLYKQWSKLNQKIADKKDALDKIGDKIESMESDIELSLGSAVEIL